jgi:hypothetical protein
VGHVPQLQRFACDLIPPSLEEGFTHIHVVHNDADVDALIAQWVTQPAAEPVSAAAAAAATGGRTSPAHSPAPHDRKMHDRR